MHVIVTFNLSTKPGKRVQMGCGLSSYNSFVTIAAATREKQVAFPNGEDVDTLESARNEIVRLRTHLVKMFDEFEAVKRKQVTRALALRLPCAIYSIYCVYCTYYTNYTLCILCSVI